MPKHILIVESDPDLSAQMRAEFEQRGFSVEETAEGKGSVELIRSRRPDLVVLAVDLSSGQNGYILCGKLKKDDDLKSIPVVIVGNPEGFGQHRKLKTRADEYVAKPVDLPGFVETIGGIIGMPEDLGGQIVDETLSLGDLAEEPSVAEEIALEGSEAGPSHGDPDLDMLDAAFEEMASPGERAPSPEEPVTVDEEPSAADGGQQLRDALGDLDSDAADQALGALGGDAPTQLLNAPDLGALQSSDAPQGSTPDERAGAEMAELATLRARVAELEQAIRSPRKDKESARLRSELDQKDRELSRKDEQIRELQERETHLEQQLADGSAEVARRDAQIKALSQKGDQMALEKKRFDQQLTAAKDETRAVGQKLAHAESELEELRTRAGQFKKEASDFREQVSRWRQDGEAARREADQARSQVQELRDELEAAKGELSAQGGQSAPLRARIAELEESTARHEQRLTKLYQRIKGEEKVREKTKKAISIALQLLEESSLPSSDADEPAAA